jgi:hypothetical protein
VLLDLDRHRTLGELIGLTFELFGRHLATFLTLTLIVVAPVVIVVDGIWGRTLADGGDADPSLAASVASTALSVLVIPPLVTALHVVVVQVLARGEEPTIAGTLRSAAPRLLAAVGAVVLYVLGTAVGLVLLIVPGVWLGVRWFFAAQAAVVDGLGPVAALARSAEVVQTRWWRTFGVLIAFSLLVGILGAILTAILQAVHDGALYTAGYIVLQSILLSLSAIFGTVLFFDSRARGGSLPWEGTPALDSSFPERP